MEIAFTVYGIPVAQGRPRTAVIAGHAVVYDPGKSKDYKHYVKVAASQALGDSALLERPLQVEIVAVLPIPQSFSKKKHIEALCGNLRPAKKPDADNFQKCVWDACNGVVWRDDSQIVDARIKKLYGEKPLIKVEVKEL